MNFTIDVMKVIFPEYRLKKDGSFGKIEKEKADEIMENDYVFNDFHDAKSWKKNQGFINVGDERVEVNPTSSNLTDYYVTVSPKRINKPQQNHITKEQLKSVLLNGDDNRNNALIIDFEGHLKLLPFEESLKYPYAVRYEAFLAGNGYVGRNIELNHLDRTYLGLLQGWASHLASQNQIYIDYAEPQTEEEVKEEISKYLKKYK